MKHFYHPKALCNAGLENVFVKIYFFFIRTDQFLIENNDPVTHFPLVCFTKAPDMDSFCPRLLKCLPPVFL